MGKRNYTQRQQNKKREKQVPREKKNKEEQNGLKEDRLDVRNRLEQEVKENVKEEKEKRSGKVWTVLSFISVGLLMEVGKEFVDVLFEGLGISAYLILGLILFIVWKWVEDKNKEYTQEIVEEGCTAYWKKKELEKKLSEEKENQIKQEVDLCRSMVEKLYAKIKRNVAVNSCIRGIIFCMAGFSLLAFVNNSKSENSYENSIPTAQVTQDSETETVTQPETVSQFPKATYTPVPADEAQDAFDNLWNVYLVGFPLNKNMTVETAKNTARNIIEKEWIQDEFAETHG